MSSAQRAALPSFYRPELDVLRFGAFLLVFLHHSLPHSATDYGIPREVASVLAGVARAGALGVDLFFALSAYLITELLLRERRSRGAIDIRAFYMRRILRIWPLYSFALLILVPVMSILPGEHMPRNYLAAFALFGGNWACAACGYPASSFALLWSVSIEEQFYLTWPWVVRVSVRLGEIHRRRIACGMLAIATVTRIVLVIRDVHHPGIWCNTLACFLNGTVPVHTQRTRVLWIGFGVVMLIGSGAIGGNEGWPVLVTYPLAAAASVAIIFGILGARLHTGSYFGKISYGLYVFHAAAIRITPSPLVALPLTIAIAAVSYRYLESPFLRLKHRFARL